MHFLCAECIDSHAAASQFRTDRRTYMRSSCEWTCAWTCVSTVLQTLVDRVHKLAIDSQATGLFCRDAIRVVLGVAALLALDHHVPWRATVHCRTTLTRNIHRVLCRDHASPQRRMVTGEAGLRRPCRCLACVAFSLEPGRERRIGKAKMQTSHRHRTAARSCQIAQHTSRRNRSIERE